MDRKFIATIDGFPVGKIGGLLLPIPGGTPVLLSKQECDGIKTAEAVARTGREVLIKEMEPVDVKPKRKPAHCGRRPSPGH